MRRQTAARVGYFTESVIREMTRLTQPARRHQPGSGISRFRPARRADRGRIGGIARRGTTSTRSRGDRRALRKAIADKVAWCNGIEVDPERHDHRTCGATEAMMATLLAVVDPGRRSHRLRALLRELRPRCDAVRRDARASCALDPPAGHGRFDPTELRAAFGPKHAGDHRQHAAQSHRQGLHARGNRADRAPCAASATCWRSPTRCTSTSSTMAPAHLQHGVAARDGASGRSRSTACRRPTA